MTDSVTMSWAGLLLLGAFHGVNPGMGWLFAVALGLQEKRRRAVWRAMLPLGLGHALAILAAVAVAALLGRMLPLAALKWMVAGVLLVLGGYRLFRHRHMNWVGMRVNMKDLTLWSFLMASAHGAGLMVLPFVMAAPAGVMAMPAHHTHAMGVPAPGWLPLVAIAVHSLAYLGVTTLVAWTVYRKLGLALLRKAWWNLDLMWAASLLGTGVLTAAM